MAYKSCLNICKKHKKFLCYNVSMMVYEQKGEAASDVLQTYK